MSQLAILYSRFSSSEQSKGYSLERQQTLGLQFATEQGWVIEKTISDEGRSAFHGANRLEGSALHEFELEARNGLHRGKVLVVENIDRLSRQGPRAAAQLIWGLNESGVDVATYHDGRTYRGEENSDLLDVFTLILNAQNAHQESFKKSKRTSASWQKRFESISEGTLTASIPHTPMWIDRTGGGFALNQSRTAVLNEIFDLYIDGVGIHRIVGILNERGEPSWAVTGKNENGWFYSYVYRLLNKRAVLGEYVTNAGKTLATNFFPQAVTAEKWNQAQAALALRKGNQKRTKTIGNRNLLTQMVFCAECGGGAHFEHTTDAAQTYRKVSGEVVNYRRKTYRRLRCDRARRKRACNNATVLNYDVVEATILDQLLPKLVDRRGTKETERRLREQISELSRLRDAQHAKMNNLIDALATVESKAIAQRVAAIEIEMEEQSQLIEATQKALAIEASKPSNDDDISAVGRLGEDLASEDDEVRIYARGRVNMALRRLIKRILVNPDDTFAVEPDDLSRWLFDEHGVLLEGAHVPA